MNLNLHSKFKDMKKRLIKVLSFIPEGQYVYLENDVFLTGYLDGSDKIYGFGRLNGEFVVIGDSPYPIDNLTNDDLSFIFKSSEIYSNIKNARYRIKDI